MAEALARARERGLRSVAFTEHVRREGSEWFTDFAREVRACATRSPGLEVFVGCEAKALDTNGTLDVSEAILAECDIVLASVHRWPVEGGGVVNFADLPPDEFAETETLHALGLLTNERVDVLAHPGGMYQRRHGVFPERLMRRVVESSLEHKKAIEISSSYLRDIDGFIRLCREIDPYVSIGSDAHDLDTIGNCREVVLSYLGGAA